MRRRRATAVGLRLRAGAPKFVRVLALALGLGGVVFLGISFYRLRNHQFFRMRSGPAQLSTEVVGEINNLERREMKGDRLYLLLQAARDRVFSDGHHELENVHFEVYPEHGDHPDKIVAQRTVTSPDNTRFSFTGNVQIETRDQLKATSEAVDYDLRNEVGVVSAPINFERENVSGRSDSATLDARNKKLELRGNVEITVQPDAKGAAGGDLPKMSLRGRPVTVKAAQADFDQAALHLAFSGGAVAEQGTDVMSGDILAGTLSEQKRLKLIEVRGNSYLRSTSEGHAAEVFAVNMDFVFNPEQKLEHAHANGNVRAHSLDSDAEVQLTTNGSADLDFDAQGERSLLRELRADNRPVVMLSAPKSKAGDPRAASKRLVADNVRLHWRATGRDIERAEAEGSAELLVEPVTATPRADRKTITAPNFACDFYETGNVARTCTATGGARAVAEPMQPAPERATRTLTAAQMTAQFVRETQDVERVDAGGEARFTEAERTLTSQQMTALFSRETQGLERVDANGEARFNERDRNGQAASISYTAGDAYVRLHGGEPVVWDSRARLKATEIDSDTRNKISYGRGKVATTYYSQEQTGGAAPFGKVKSPVFVISNAAEFQHDAGVGIYTGAARMWQDDNFVRADRLVLRRDAKRLDGEGSVQSALYQAKRKDANGNQTVVPVFATSRRMFYVDGDRLLHYEEDVDIRQGTERITSAVADVYLQKESYEVERTIAQRNVVVTQPGKRGTGDWAQYTAADETVVLTGNPAHVEDPEQGTSESRRLTVYLRENRVVSDGGGDAHQPANTGRVRSTHKVRKQ